MNLNKEKLNKTIKYVKEQGSIVGGKAKEMSKKATVFFKEQTSVVNKNVKDMSKKASVFLKEQTSVVGEKAKEMSKKSAIVVKAKAVSMYEVAKSKSETMLEGKNLSFVKEIHFNFHHMVSVCVIALVAFFVTLYSTGYNTAQVDASNMTTEVKAFNKTAMNVAYGENITIANMAKDILGEQISTVEEPKEISNSGLETVYEIGDYVATITIDAKLGSTEADLMLETKKTYASKDTKKIITPAQSKDVMVEDGASYTYNIKLNITDTQAPEINLISDDITIMDTDEFAARDFVNAITDNADGVIAEYSVENDIARVADGKLESGKHVLTFRAKDSSGNESAKEFIVRVQESEEESDAAQSATTSSTRKGNGYNAPSANVPGSGKGSIIASAAMGQLGVYQDCTALVSNSLAAAGIYYHGWPSGYLSLGTIVPYSQAQPGDIVVYNGHVAIYVGNGMCVHGGFNGNQTVLFSINCSSGAYSIVRV